jgi:peroxiredoxin
VSDPSNPPKTRAEALAVAEALAAPLSERLAAFFMMTGPLRPEIQAAYLRIIERLKALRLAEIGPKIGEPMPDFILPDQRGQLVTLEALVRDGPVVLCFNRGHWCPYCQLALRAIAVAHDEARSLGGQIVSIVPERAQFSKKMTTDNKLPFRVLSDVDLSYALSLGLVYWIGAEMKAIYDTVGVDLANYQGNGNYFLPLAATFVVAADGTVADRHVDPDFRNRMDIDRMLAALARLRKNQAASADDAPPAIVLGAG